MLLQRKMREIRNKFGLFRSYKLPCYIQYILECIRRFFAFDKYNYMYLVFVVMFKILFLCKNCTYLSTAGFAIHVLQFNLLSMAYVRTLTIQFAVTDFAKTSVFVGCMLYVCIWYAALDVLVRFALLTVVCCAEMIVTASDKKINGLVRI